MSVSYKLKYAGYTHIGMKRVQNQDHFLCIPDLAAFIVADGMGGHKGGETASLLAVTTVCDYIRSAKAAAKDGRITWDPQTVLADSIIDANRAIQERASQTPELQGMGTTCTALLFERDQAYIGHVGDSRCYLIHPNKIWQLTRDHSLVQEKLRAGLITRDQVKTDRMKNIITRSVGFESQLDIDVYQMAIRPGDTFLICSDGLSGMVDDNELSQVTSKTLKGDANLGDLAKTLCQTANTNGGDDNITSVIVNVC